MFVLILLSFGSSVEVLFVGKRNENITLGEEKWLCLLVICCWRLFIQTVLMQFSSINVSSIPPPLSELLSYFFSFKITQQNIVLFFSSCLAFSSSLPPLPLFSPPFSVYTKSCKTLLTSEHKNYVKKIKIEEKAKEMKRE